MKNAITALLLSLSLLSPFAFARDDVASYSIHDALNTENAKAKLGNEVAFYFGNQKYNLPVKKFGEFKTNKKTNSFNKTDLEACQWVFLSAMIVLKNRALKEGGNAVVDIKSNYKNNLTSNNETFKCGAGSFIAGVALTGQVVTLK